MLNEASKGRMPWHSVVISVLAGWCFAPPALAGKTGVVEAQGGRDSDGRYRVKVLVRQGGEHYGNAGDMMVPDGILCGIRVLLHPHEHPFVRYLSKLIILDGIAEAMIWAVDIKHGGGCKKMTLKALR